MCVPTRSLFYSLRVKLKLIVGLKPKKEVEAAHTNVAHPAFLIVLMNPHR